jgi:hypothetical protein
MKAKLIMAIILACAVQQVHAEDTVDSLHQLVTDKAHEQNVPTELAHAVVIVESNYQPKAFNQGSYGIGQIRCGTARGVGFHGNCRELFKPDINLTYSFIYLRMALDIAEDNYCLAATLYNEGLASRSRRGKYCRKVLKHIQKE